MPIRCRDKEPDLNDEIDDYTDRWRNAPSMVLQHGFGGSSKFGYCCVPYMVRIEAPINANLPGLATVWC